ncbi:MAG: hypothetical protein HY535_06015 [Chloroflexi bacterium]|nr:hypothetical protein [Chloroflexota bacterium]
MGKLGTYSYPDIRFGDAVEIAGRILNKFRGTVTVKGLAWELGMAENSGTLFAKSAALRDFGLVEGRGELRVSDLGRRVLLPTSPEEGRQARAQAFQRVDLLRYLYERFEGEAPDDSALLIALEEITRAPREEIVRRFTLIQKHLADASRVLKGLRLPMGLEPATLRPIAESSIPKEELTAEDSATSRELQLVAGTVKLTAALTPENVEAVIVLLQGIKGSMEKAAPGARAAARALLAAETGEFSGAKPL